MENPPGSLDIILPDGSHRQFPAGTTPNQIASQLQNPQAAARYIVSEVVIGEEANPWDMHRPLVQNCKISFLEPENPKSFPVLLHSAAHILGAALQKKYGMNLAVGPALEESFYYEGRCADGSAIPPSDFPEIEKIMEEMISKRVRFERQEIPKEEALRMFASNPYKIELITTKVADSATVSIYRCGDFVDLCRGPHIPNAGFIKAYKVTKCGSSYFLGDNSRDSLQRVYGVAFATKDAYKAWQKEQELAALRDHRLIGQKQELFFFNELSPGSCFFLPRGAHLYNKLVDFMKSLYPRWGFTEVISPNVYNKTLWEISGHWQNYKDGMFTFDVEGRQFGIKPMNCPGHCLMYLVRPRSYRELPLRLAEFGICHRNELSGALNGLMRVRRFMQDDGHIFVRPDQIEQELMNCLDFMHSVYSTFKLNYTLELSTRPEKYLGEIADWDSAEQKLRNALDRFGHPYQINPGDGAFYGPKIDVKIKDAIGREWQCATIQCDFNLPERFDISYIGADGEKHRPVMLHRVILGSVERFLGVLIEHYAGAFPVWLAPVQAVVMNITDDQADYAKSVADKLKAEGLRVETDLRNEKVGFKIREHQLMKVPYMLVAGDREMQDSTVNVRERGGDQRTMTVDEFIELVKSAEPKL